MPKVPRIVDFATDASTSPLGCEFILMESQQIVEDTLFSMFFGGFFGEVRVKTSVLPRFWTSKRSSSIGLDSD